MQTIEIKEGVNVDMDEMVLGASKMDTPILEQYVSKLENLLANRKVKSPSKKERELLTRINQRKLHEKEQARYDFLSSKFRDETISDKEHRELLKLVQIAEQHNAGWLEALAELSRLRGVEINELLQQLGIPPQHTNP